MRFDLSDLDRLTGFADALERLFWCLIVVGLFSAILGSPGTGLFLLILAAAAFVVRIGLEDFVRSRGRRKESVAPKKAAPPQELVIEKTKPAAKRKAAPEPEFNVYRTSRRPRRKKSAV